MCSIKHVILVFSTLIYIVKGIEILNGDIKDITSGSKLVLECAGDIDLQWVYSNMKLNDSRVKTITSQVNTTYKVSLEIEPAEFTDTGYYFCSDVNETVDVQRIYVFVNDPEHLFLPEKHDAIQVHNNFKFVIPCLPTFSDLNVTLWRRDERIVTDDSVYFDPLTGFIVKNANSSFSGFYECRAMHEQKLQKLVFDLKFKYVPILPPRINASKIIDLPRRMSIALSCEGEYDTYWIFPENEVKALFDPLNLLHWMVEELENMTIAELRYSTLLDSGYVTCCYKGYKCDLTSTASSVFLRITDPKTVRLEVLEKSSYQYELKCVPYIIHCIPSNTRITVKLKLLNYQELSVTQAQLDEDFSFDPTVGFIPNDFQKFLRKYRMGKFVCIFSYSIVHQSMETKYSELPTRHSIQVTVSNSNPYEGEYVEMTCDACKFAFKSITWKWKGSATQQSYNSIIANGNLTGVELFDESSKYNLKITLRIHSTNFENNGTYECVGVSYDEMENVESVNLRIKDREKPIFIKTNMNGTSVTVSSGSKWEFLCYVHGTPDPVITWYKDGNTLDALELTKEDFYKGFQKLTLIRVGRSDSGTYRCEAKNSAGTIITETNLKVAEESQNPEASSMSHSKLNSSVSSIIISFTVLCVILIIGLCVVIYIIAKRKLNIKRFPR